MPAIAIRGRSFIALIVSPEAPLGDWFEALDQQMQRAAGFFANRPVVVNLLGALGAEEGLAAVLDALDARDMKIIGVEGIEPAVLAGTRWEGLVQLQQGRDLSYDGRTDRLITVPDGTQAGTQAVSVAEPVAPAPVASLLLDRPVRSGQSIIFEEGDITVIGAVASGAEVIAGGSIHVYGALRGRAIGGLRSGAAARIFCRKLVAELVALDGLYHAPEHWGEGFHGRAAQIRLDQGALRLEALE
jgi:septum site-determining protein MinC